MYIAPEMIKTKEKKRKSKIESKNIVISKLTKREKLTRRTNTQSNISENYFG